MTSQPGAETLTDTSEMAVVHTFFRRELRLAPGVVRNVPVGDTARARVVAAHLDFVTRSLHHHHTNEDDLLWPLLLQRLPEEMTSIVHLMEAQHQRVDALLGDLAVQLPGWRADANGVDRDRIAELLDELYVHLVEHLDDEEQRLLPIAARALTQAEWDAGGEAARAAISRSDRLLSFGMIQHDGDPQIVTAMLADAPAPVRWLLPRLAGRAFRRHAMRIHGTATP